MKMCTPSVLHFFNQWRQWIHRFLFVLYIILIIAIVPVLVVHYHKDKSISIGGAFVLLTLPISIWQITQHVIHYNKPHLQIHIVRVLWMVPVYSVNAFIGLIYPMHAVYIDCTRECYEAYVIYNFMKYLLNYLNEDRDLEEYLETKPAVKHLFPFCWFRPWEMGRELVHNCKHGILQYTVVRPITTVIAVTCELNNVYGESDFSPKVAFPYMLAINNLSQCIAMYCLILFYKATRDELKPINPLGKFLCIKAVVFFSFFQGVIVNILVYTHVISSIFSTDHKGEIRTISIKIQDFLICIEMFVAAIAHHFSFSYKAFISPLDSSPSCLASFVAMWDVSDVKRDISEHLGVVGSSFSRRLRGKSMYRMARGHDENTCLVPEPVASRSTPSFVVNAEETFGESSPRISTTYGSIVTTVPDSAETEPLIVSDEQNVNDNPTA